jgi:HD superfamily phosphohydrolase
MIYAKRFGAFMPIVTLLTSLIVTYLLYPWAQDKSPLHWRGTLIAIGFSIFALIWCVVYVGNLILIRFSKNPEFAERLRLRWRSILMSASDPAPIQDFVDRMADLQVKISHPKLLKQAITELSQEKEAAAATLQKTIDAYADKNDLRAFMSALGKRWMEPPPFRRCHPALIDDPVHGCVSLDSDLATIIAQPIVQRLNRIRQLSFSYTHFPSATHSRLSHVLGVAHNVERALNGVFSRGVFYEEGAKDPKEIPEKFLDNRDALIRRAKVLAVLHDLGHGPFGHALDNYVGYINKHEKTANPDKAYSRLYLERHLSNTLENLGFYPGDLVRVLNPKQRDELTGFETLIGDLIDSPMDMDRMDYLMRDAHMTGLSMGFTNADALIQCVRPVQAEGAFLLAYDESGVEYMEHLLYAREAMYRSCYEHPRKRAAERIFERLVRIVADDNPDLIDELYILTDEELLTSFKLVDLKSAAANHLLDQLTNGSDYVVVHDVRADSVTISQEALVWVKGATMGKGKPSYIDQPALWEDEIARASIGADRSFQIQAIVAPPGAYQHKFDATTILCMQDGVFKTKELFDVAITVKEVLAAMNPARARIKVMCSGDMTAEDRAKVSEAAASILGR